MSEDFDEDLEGGILLETTEGPEIYCPENADEKRRLCGLECAHDLVEKGHIKAPDMLKYASDISRFLESGVLFSGNVTEIKT